MSPVPQPEHRTVYTTGPRLRITDATDAAALMTAGHNLLAVTRVSRRKAVFLFEDTPAIRAALTRFYSSRMHVIAIRERCLAICSPPRPQQTAPPAASEGA